MNPATEISFDQAYESLSLQEKQMLKLKSSGATLEQIAIALKMRTKNGGPNIKAVFQQLNVVLEKLDKSIQGW
jgi:hypothetical protein